jgi:hypothetical protein
MAMTNVWNSNPTNSNGIKPIRTVGSVILNAKYDDSVVLKATSNENPYYPTPAGQYFEYIRFAPNRLIAWSEVSSEYNISHLYTNVYDSLNPDSDKVRAAVSINGQGKGLEPGWDNNTFMQGIHIHGIVTDGTDGNGSNKFNILCGGTTTIPNTGNEDIMPGDYVYAYAPTRQEVMDQEGGRKTDAERNGYITLWTKPYQIHSHKITTSNVSRCLMTEPDDHNQPFSPNFTKTATALLESQVDAMAEIIATIVGEVDEVAGANQQQQDLSDSIFALAIRTMIGHKGYSKTSYIKTRNDFISNNRETLVGALFMHHNDNKHAISNPMEKSLACQAILLKDFTRLIIGKAVTGAQPGGDFEITLCKYAK